MSQKIKVAGVGAGYFSQFHYDSWSRHPNVELLGVCDKNLETAAAMADRHGVNAWGALDDMLREERPDLLDVILPPVAQADAILAGLSAGVKAIICQKPFCQSINEAEEITTEAEAASIPLVVHENFRFQPWYRAIKSVIDAGTLGDLHQMCFRLRPGDGQGDRAYLDRQPYFRDMERFLVHETAVHWIDTFRFLLGDVTAVYADLRQRNLGIKGEDAGVILFDHAGGAQSLFDGNRHLDHAADNLRRTMGEASVEGTAGQLTLSGDGSVTFRRYGSLETETIQPPDTFDGFGGDCVHALQSHVISGLLEGTPLENQTRDYLTVLKLEAAIYASANTGRKITMDDD